MSSSPQNVSEILDCLDQLAEDGETTAVGDIFDAFGNRTFGPAIMVPALLEVTPVGAIPGVPTFLAITIAIVAAQKMFGKKHLWIPGIIGNRKIANKKLAKGVKKLRPVGDFMDRHLHRRWRAMTRSPFSQVAAGIVVLLCLTVPFLEVLPFASSAPMLAIAGFGLAVLMRDGVLMAMALAASVAAMAIGFDYWDGGMSDTEQVDGMVDQETVDTVKQSADEAGTAVQQTAEDAGAAVAQAGNDAAEAMQGE